MKNDIKYNTKPHGQKLRHIPAFEVLEERLVFSATRVNNTAAYPYSAVAHVDAWFDANRNGRVDIGESWGGSAVMIGENSALTSAHVIYRPNLGGFATSVTIQPGKNGATEPFGAYRAVGWVIPSGYKNNPGSVFDIGVLNFAPVPLLSGTQSVGDQTGWFGYGAYSDSFLTGRTVNNIGYPADTRSGVEQFLSSGRITKAAAPSGVVGWIEYKTSEMPVERGSSGSPIYRKTGSDRYIVGIHSRRNSAGTIGYATRITSSMMRFITRAEAVTAAGGRMISFDINVPVSPIGFFLDSNAISVAAVMPDSKAEHVKTIELGAFADIAFSKWSPNGPERGRTSMQCATADVGFNQIGNPATTMLASESAGFSWDRWVTTSGSTSAWEQILSQEFPASLYLDGPRWGTAGEYDWERLSGLQGGSTDWVRPGRIKRPAAISDVSDVREVNQQ